MSDFFEEIAKVRADSLVHMVGYSEEEICRLEQLYDIEIKCDFKKFLLRAGRCDGGVIGDGSLLFYRQSLGINSCFRTQQGFRRLLSEHGAIDFLRNRPFVFSIEGEQLYAFIQTTLGDDQPVYYYDENEDDFKNTHLTFSEYLLGFVRNNPKGSSVVSSGDFVVPKSVRSEKYSIRSPAGLNELFAQTHDEAMIGFTDSELNQIEDIYRVRVDGQLMTLLAQAGRFAGPLFREPLTIFAPNYNLREHLLLQYQLVCALAEIKASAEFVGSIFLISIEEGTRHYYLRTSSSSADVVYFYDDFNKTVLSTGMTLFAYMSDVLSRYPASRSVANGSLLSF